MRRSRVVAAVGAAFIMVVVAGIASALPPETPTETTTPILAGTPTVTPPPTELPNYLTLDAELENLDGEVRSSYRCDFGRYDFEEVPVDVYLVAVAAPVFSEGEAFSLDDLFASGEVRIFTSAMRSYVYAGVVKGPTFLGVRFPPMPVEGSFVIDAVSSGIYQHAYALAAVFTRAGTDDFIRTDGLPATGTGTFTPFQYHVKLLNATLHVGDGYDPYMATWEVTHPEGIRVERTFYLDHIPTGAVALRAGYWATLYADNPVYINGEFVGYLPALHNYNIWAWSQFCLSPSLFHIGANSIVFKSGLRPPSTHYDNYLVKGWEIFYN
jgi:hypothetical protein